jgi:hypothetical protein
MRKSHTFLKSSTYIARCILPSKIHLWAIRPWLYKITWSVYCNYMHRLKLQPWVPLDTSEDSAFLELEDDGHEQPEAAFENMESRLLQHGHLMAGG